MARPKKETTLTNAERQRKFKAAQRKRELTPPPATLVEIPPPRAVKTRHDTERLTKAKRLTASGKAVGTPGACVPTFSFWDLSDQKFMESGNELYILFKL